MLNGLDALRLVPLVDFLDDLFLALTLAKWLMSCHHFEQAHSESINVHFGCVMLVLVYFRSHEFRRSEDGMSIGALQPNELKFQY